MTATPMRVFVDGATGYLGRAVLRALVDDGHQPVAHARTTESAATLDRAGAHVVVGDLTDPAWLTWVLGSVDAAVHTASPGDATSGEFDRQVASTVLDAFAGTGRPYVHTGGTWIHGSGTGITEHSPLAPPGIVAWRPAVNDLVRAGAHRDVRSMIVAPANLYGHAGGLLTVLLHGPTRDGALLYPGRDQRFANVFVDDAAAAFVTALTDAPPGSYYVIANPHPASMSDIAAAAARLRGLDQTHPEPVEDSRERLGPLAEAFLLDASIDATLAHRQLHWHPRGPALLDDLGHGSYAHPDNSRQNGEHA